jgi:methyl-accepting chemotaxis protein
MFRHFRCCLSLLTGRLLDALSSKEVSTDRPRSLMSQSFSTVMTAIEDQHKRTMGSIEMMNENFIDVLEGMLKMSEKLENVISLVSELASSSAEIQNISEGVAELRMASRG